MLNSRESEKKGITKEKVRRKSGNGGGVEGERENPGALEGLKSKKKKRNSKEREESPVSERAP